MAEFNARSQPDPSTSAPIERRAWVRFGSDLEAACRTGDARNEVGWPAQVRDVSAGGIGLLLRHRFRPGTPLVLELKTNTGKFLGTVSVRVIHATAEVVDGNHLWLLGCRFATQLSDEQLQALLCEPPG